MTRIRHVRGSVERISENSVPGTRSKHEHDDDDVSSSTSSKSEEPHEIPLADDAIPGDPQAEPAEWHPDVEVFQHSRSHIRAVGSWLKITHWFTKWIFLRPESASGAKSRSHLRMSFCSQEAAPGGWGWKIKSAGRCCRVTPESQDPSRWVSRPNRYVKSLLHWSMWKGVFHLISQSGCQVTHVAVEIFHETDFNIFLWQVSGVGTRSKDKVVRLSCKNAHTQCVWCCPERVCFDSYRDLNSACCRLDSHGNTPGIQRSLKGQSPWSQS